MNLNETILYFNIISLSMLFYGLIMYGYSCMNERKSNISTEDILFIESILD